MKEMTTRAKKGNKKNEKEKKKKEELKYHAATSISQHPKQYFDIHEKRIVV